MHPTAARVAERLRRRGRVRAATGFSIGGVPPLGHDQELETIVDQSLLRFDVVWAAAGTPHDVFAVEVDALLGVLARASVTDVS